MSGRLDLCEFAQPLRDACLSHGDLRHREYGTGQPEIEAAAKLRQRYLSSWLALLGEQMEVQLFDNP